MGSFGSCCKRIMDEYDIKSRSIAHAVNYDASYISKWINDGILPGIAASDGVCRAIAKLASERLSTDAQQRQDAYGRIYAELTKAYAKDSKAVEAKRSKGEAAAAETRIVGRKDTLFRNLRDLRNTHNDCVLSIMGDFAAMDANETVLVIDILNYIRELKFEGGVVYFFLPEDGLDHMDSGMKMVKVVNLLMVDSKVKIECYRTLITCMGIVILGNGFLYVAQGWNHGQWLVESMKYDRDQITRIIKTLGRDIMPTAERLCTDLDLQKQEDRAVLSRFHSRLLLGMCSAQLAPQDLIEQLSGELDRDIVDLCKQMSESFEAGLAKGQEMHCLFYQHALAGLAEKGRILIGNTYLTLSPRLRLAYLRHIKELIDSYPNFIAKATKGYIIKAVKHRYLPVVYFDELGLSFARFPIDGKVGFFRVIDHGTRKAFDLSFESLWQGDEVPLVDVGAVLDEYLQVCISLVF